jgi:hypothetical protein
MYLGCHGVYDGDELLCDDRQHLDVDSVELVKAAPSSRLSQTGEESTHHLQTSTVNNIYLPMQ